uniref:Transmembrane protein 68 n=1 Tax=Heliothis virescens TaxID=7102 RepID=A0A2A4JMN1_HELVI
MVKNQCDARPVKAYIMSDLLKKFDHDTRNDVVQIAVAIAGFYLGMFCLEYVDAEYSLWLTWFLMPVIVTFLLPAVIIVLIYISVIIFHLYRLYRMKVVDGVQPDWKHAARLAVCALWDAHGWLWHALSLNSRLRTSKVWRNIPYGPFPGDSTYHGALPIDIVLLSIARMPCLFLRGRHITFTVADRSIVYKLPESGGDASPRSVYALSPRHSRPLPVRQCCRMATLSAHLPRASPIIPMFTQNVREAFRTVGWLRGVWLKIYATFRMPLAPVYGGFPVKLVTHLGPPIPYDPDLTPEQLQLKVARAIEDLVEEHQRLPGSILQALIERVHYVPKRRKALPPVTNGKCQNGALKQNDSDKSESAKSKVS